MRTLSAAEAAEQIGCSQRWLLDQLRAGRFRGRKIGRSWRLTEDDVIFALDVCANRVVPVMEAQAVLFSSLSPTSRRKLGER
ncbi:helix-turn-helix domain-containing protein [Mycolicibacterium sp. A43C]